MFPEIGRSCWSDIPLRSGSPTSSRWWVGQSSPDDGVMSSGRRGRARASGGRVARPSAPVAGAFVLTGPLKSGGRGRPIDARVLKGSCPDWFRGQCPDDDLSSSSKRLSAVWIFRPAHSGPEKITVFDNPGRRCAVGVREDGTSGLSDGTRKEPSGWPNCLPRHFSGVLPSSATAPACSRRSPHTFSSLWTLRSLHITSLTL